MATTEVRLGSTYRVIVPFYALSDGTTLTDLDSAPSLQVYDQAGVTAIGSAITCTKDSTGIYHGDIELVSTTFTAGTVYQWIMAGHSGGKDQSMSGYLVVLQVV